MKPTIITLTPSSDTNDTLTVASFEEAFGEFSEARGRGRERRRKRKAERQRNRQEKRMARIRNRAERRRARQSMRAEQQEARQSRRDVRKRRKVSRKEMGEEKDSPQGEGSGSGNEGGGSGNEGGGSGNEGGGSGNEGGGSGNEGGGSGNEGGGSGNEGGGSGQEGGGSGQEGGGSGNEGGGEEGGGEEGGGESGGDESSGEEEGSGADGELNFVIDDEETSSADAETEVNFVIGDDYYDDENLSDNYFVNADGANQQINPKVRTVAQQIEDCKESVASLQTLLANAQNDTDKNKVNARIFNANKRISELEASLEGYSSARGRGKQERNRKREINKAKRIAKKRRALMLISRAKRKGVKSGKSFFKMLSKVYPPAIALRMAKKLMRQQKQSGGDETPVNAELNPEYSQNQIVIPASEKKGGFDGATGLIGIDDQQDFDAPQTREFDLTFSGATGAEAIENDKKINFKAIAIGVGIGILAIYLIKKYNK